VLHALLATLGGLRKVGAGMQRTESTDTRRFLISFFTVHPIALFTIDIIMAPIMTICKYYSAVIKKWTLEACRQRTLINGRNFISDLVFRSERWVIVGWALIANPDWVHKIADNHLNDVKAFRKEHFKRLV
jgi:hypothetical protein